MADQYSAAFFSKPETVARLQEIANLISSDATGDKFEKWMVGVHENAYKIVSQLLICQEVLNRIFTPAEVKTIILCESVCNLLYSVLIDTMQEAYARGVRPHPTMFMGRYLNNVRAAYRMN